MALLALYTIILGSFGILLCLVVPGGRLLIPLARLWSWLVLRTAGVRHTVIRHPAFDPRRPAVYIANHQSLLDVPALTLAMPGDFRMVAKRALLHVPIFGWALWLAGFVFIDRSDRDSAIRSFDRVGHRLARGTSVVVFAEGSRSNDGRLLPFKKGGFVLALQTGAPIVPVSLAGGIDLLPRGRARVRKGTIRVVFGQPVETSRYSLLDKGRLMDEVRARVEEGLQVTQAPVKPQGSG